MLNWQKVYRRSSGDRNANRNSQHNILSTINVDYYCSLGRYLWNINAFHTLVLFLVLTT